MHDHHLHLLLVCRTGAHYGLFDLGRRVFGDFHALLRTGDNGGATGLAEFEGRVGVFGHEDLFDAHRDRPVGLDHFTHAAIDDLQALGQLARAGADAARGDVDAATRGLLHHAKTGNARTGVDT